MLQKKKNNVFVSQNILRGQIVDEKQFSSRQQEKKQEIFCKLQNCKIQININWGLEFSFEVEQLVRFLQKSQFEYAPHSRLEFQPAETYQFDGAAVGLKILRANSAVIDYFFLLFFFLHLHKLLNH